MLARAGDRAPGPDHTQRFTMSSAAHRQPRCAVTAVDDLRCSIRAGHPALSAPGRLDHDKSLRILLIAEPRRAGRCLPGSAPPRGDNDLDVIAAGIWLSISGLSTGCPSLAEWRTWPDRRHGVGTEAR